MATNDFLPFATGGAANVLTQAQWAALSALLNGFQSGIADSKSINKAFRQSSIMAAVLAQFIADQTGANSVDDGTTSTLLANLKKSMPGRILGVQTFTSSGTYAPGTYGGLTATRAVVRAIGGGGGGGGAAAAAAGQASVGAGGNAGAYGELLIISGLTPQTVTIGAAGAGSVGANGSNGGTTSFGGLMVCAGGIGGVLGGSVPIPSLNFAAAASPAGVSGTGTIFANAPGSIGGFGFALSTSAYTSGIGASSVFGAGGRNSQSAGVNGSGFGSGGGGGSTSNGGSAAAGGNGTPGYLVVLEYA